MRKLRQPAMVPVRSMDILAVGSSDSLHLEVGQDVAGAKIIGLYPGIDCHTVVYSDGQTTRFWGHSAVSVEDRQHDIKQKLKRIRDEEAEKAEKEEEVITYIGKVGGGDTVATYLYNKDRYSLRGDGAITVMYDSRGEKPLDEGETLPHAVAIALLKECSTAMSQGYRKEVENEQP